MKKFYFKRRRGFTLVELMAAMAITTILVLVIVTLTRKGVDIWRTVITDVRATSKARAALDTMVSDLQSIQMRAGNDFEWLVAEKDRDIDQAGRYASADDMKMGPENMLFTNAARFIFFTSAVDRNKAIPSGEARTAMQDSLADKRTAGDVNCVGYKLEYRDQILNQEASQFSAGFPVYALYRNRISAYRTKEDLLGKTDLMAAYEKFGSEETRPTNFLAENIMELTFVFEVDYNTRGGSKAKEGENRLSYHQVENIPVIAAGTVSGSNVYRQVSIYGDKIKVEKQGSADQRMAYGNITGVSICLTVVSDEGMGIVEEVRKGRRKAPNMADFVKRYTKQFSQRIALPKPN